MSKNQKFSEAYPEAAIREGSDELTLRADEVGTLWEFINKDHIKFERGEPPLVDADWRAFCQATCTGFDGEDWEELHCHTTDMSKATGAKKPSESEKAKGLWAMKAAKDWGGSSQRQHPGEEQRHVWSCGKSTSKTRSWHWTKL